MNEKPVVSVIIPTYNRSGLLLRAIASAQQQTVENIEILVMDDGSTDGTEQVVAQVKDSRLRYCLLPHQGACVARNEGMALAKGRYIAFLDSDDVWLPEKLAIQQQQLEASGADVVFCAFERHDVTGVTRYPAEDTPAGQVDHRRLLGGNLVSTQTLFGRADCMKQVRFDPRFPRMQDWEYAIRLAKQFRLVYFPDVLARLYVQTDSISRKPELGLQAMRLLMSKYRRELQASMPNTLLMLSTAEGFAAQCGKHCAADYWKAASVKRPWKDNRVLIRRGASLLLSQPKLHTARRESL